MFCIRCARRIGFPCVAKSKCIVCGEEFLKSNSFIKICHECRKTRCICCGLKIINIT